LTIERNGFGIKEAGQFREPEEIELDRESQSE